MSPLHKTHDLKRNPDLNQTEQAALSSFKSNAVRAVTIFVPDHEEILDC